MRVLLVRPKGTAFAHAPLGLMHLASALRTRGHTPVILDGVQEPLSPEHAAGFASAWRAEVVGFGGMSCEYPETRVFAARMQRSLPVRIPFVFGGPHASGAPNQCLNDGADFVVTGEGEVTFPRLLDALSSGGCDCRIWIGEPADLEAEPEPAYDLVAMGRYAEANSPWFFPKGKRAFPLLTSRGCPYACSYCHSTHGKRFRGLAPRTVVSRLANLVSRHGIDEVMVIDDIFNFDLDRAKEICREIIRRDIQVRLQFPYGVRGDRCDQELIGLMRRAGTHYLGIAFETASPRVMQDIRKHLDIDACFRTAQWAKREGIEVCGFFMIGFPMESASEVEATIAMALNAPIDWMFLSLVAAYQGTRLRSELVPSDLDVSFPFAPAVPVSLLYRLRRNAYLRFYARPARVLRLLETLQQRRNWHKLAKAVIQRLRNSKFALN